ncbi:LOW QUALITY PROTEIN: C2 domain-containing protein [Cephalotus follicularis]|uniref:C2 domain-containing protein n=1 Tax=Cephalotus follicularis TaxID=3775 RepID=A0A1Q3DAM1_CEPFO|nr:LOW QUALITY PROTEIN: C2 domain-containing protein [Cephalotus follicularis]
MKTSKTKKNNLNLIWNEHFEFIVEDASTQHLVVKIYDDEGLQAAELIGCAQVRLSELEPGKVKDVWLKLVKDLEVHKDNKYWGQVRTLNSLHLVTLEIFYASYLGDFFCQNKEPFIASPKFVIKTRITKYCNSAEELPATDFIGKSDPYVVLPMMKTETRNKTRVENDSLNPVWNQTFDFVDEDRLHDMLILEVWDHDTFGKV